MSGVRKWLDSRQPPPPSALAVRMTKALEGLSRTEDGDRAATESVERAPAGEARVLAEAALDRLRAVLADEAGDTALDLLTADALLTYAGEASAEAGPDALEALVREFGPARLASLLPDAEERT